MSRIGRMMGLRWPDRIWSACSGPFAGKPAPTVTAPRSGLAQYLWRPWGPPSFQGERSTCGSGFTRERAISCKKILNVMPNASGSLDWELSYDLSRMPSDRQGRITAVISPFAPMASECENSLLVVFLPVHGSCARAGFGLTVVTPTRASHHAHGCRPNL